MRRPAHRRLGPTPAPGWAHPYTGLTGLAVFYNDGNQPPAAPPAPSPATVAAIAGQQPVQPAGPQPLLDKETGLAMTQDRFSKIMTREHGKGRMAALKELAEAAGVPFTHENFDVAAFGQMFKDAEQARQAQLSDDQRRTEDLARREQEFQTQRDSFAQQQAQLAAERRTLAREQSLTRLGALDITDDKGTVTTPNLQDALAMLDRDLRDTPDADTAAITTAAENLKKRRPELFGTGTVPQALPAAPSGGPAAGGPPRPPVPGKDAVNEAARARARAMGLRTDDAA
ncbi:hypothetical protein ACIQVL_48330 [Streptomyces sp. NPDC090499]|uniref:hypothetical protein n=1 Tax=Streptomyces sp. NPDC090499 TaxID=3365965 RepID=UPI0037FEB568